MKLRRQKLLNSNPAILEACEPRQLLAGGTLRGVAWNDINDNGAREGGEPALANWTIYLDANHNGRFDSGETSTQTGGDGAYAFTGLAAGNYLVGQVIKPGWRQTHPAVAVAVSAPALASATPSDAVSAAIRRSSDLSRYGAAELASARQWVIAPTGKTTVASIVSKTGAKSAAPTGLLPNTYVLTFPGNVSGGKAANRLRGAAGLSWFYPLVARQQQGRAVAPNDPLFSSQWHLNNNAAGGADLNVLPAWDLADGTGVTVAVVDEGVQHTHPDLSANYVAAHSYDFNGNDADPSPNIANGEFHGTEVTGLVSAVRNNGRGVSGVAPGAKFAGIRLTAASTTDAQEAQALAYHRDSIAVYSNSWGPDDDGQNLTAPGAQTLAALQQSVTLGRGGKGNVYVWAAGNGLPYDDNVNYDGYANSRYVIATTAVNEFGEQAYYAEPGAPIFVSAFGGDDNPGITTTDISGPSGDHAGDYLGYFSGTSAATPMVSGVVALMLDANPNLTWRDVKHILASTAVRNDPTDSDWVRNGAGHWVNHKYGFGQVDAAAAVQAAVGWTNVGAEKVVSSGTVAVGRMIPDNNPTTGVASTFTVGGGLLRVETVEVVLDASIGDRGDLRVVLTSPDGTRSVLAEPRADRNPDYANWTFTTTHHWDEMAQGTWTLRVTDERGSSVGQVRSWKLNLYGTSVVGQRYASVADGATVSGQDFGSRALPGARVTAADLPNRGGPQRLVFTFDQNVAGSISADDLELFNQTTGQVVATGSTALTYDAATRTATWTFPAFSRGILPDGDYSARLKSSQITLADGRMLDANGDGMGGDDFTHVFTFLQGDLTRDRKVDAADADILLRNVGRTNATWDEGDLNYDGKVAFTDYQMMELAFRHSLPGTVPAARTESAVAPAQPASAAAAPTTTATTESSKKPKPTPVAKKAPVSPAVVAPSLFSVRPLGRRNADLLDSLPDRV